MISRKLIDAGTWPRRTCGGPKVVSDMTPVLGVPRTPPEKEYRHASFWRGEQCLGVFCGCRRSGGRCSSSTKCITARLCLTLVRTIKLVFAVMAMLTFAGSSSETALPPHLGALGLAKLAVFGPSLASVPQDWPHCSRYRPHLKGHGADPSPPGGSRSIRKGIGL